MDAETSAFLLHSSFDKNNSTMLLQGNSGISISKDWILTHGSALKTVIGDSAISNFMLDMVPGKLTIVPSKFAEKLKFKVYRDPRTKSDPNDKSHDQEHFGTVVAAWKCSLLKITFDTFFRGWKFPKSYSYEELLRTVFLLVRVDSDELIDTEISMVEQALHGLLFHTIRLPTRGLLVEVVSTPFGNPVLANSVARGIISNVVGVDNCIIMTDAFAFPKSEGGPVYVTAPDRKRRIITGMVVAPVSWCRGEWVDYTFAANLASCLTNILHIKDFHCSPIADHNYYRKINETLDRSIVEIRCGINSGTAILLDKRTGTFLTCSHIVKQAPEREILIDTKVKFRVSAKLVYKTPSNEPYDVAVLKVNSRHINPSLQPIRLSDAPILKGNVAKRESVISMGFPIFSSPDPTISVGVVSKVVDCILLTTCCTQSGSSGSPIISQKTGEMLGLITSNVMASDNTRTLYTRMSMAIPASVLRGPLRQYLHTENPDVLQAFTCGDPKIRKIWNLYPLLPSKL